LPLSRNGAFGAKGTIFLTVRPNAYIKKIGFGSLRCLLAFFLERLSMSNFFRSIFGSKKSPAKIKPRMQSRRLELLGLEERITPVNGVVLVDFTTNTGVLSLTSIAADFSVVANANGTLSVSVINSTYIVSAGSSTTITVSSIGTTNDYTVSVNSGAANVKQLSLIENDSIDNNFVISSIDSTAFNTDFALNIDTGAGTGDTLTINGAVALKGTGALTTAGIETLTIAAAGDITAVNGDVSLVASIINTAGDVVTTAGNIIIGDASLSGNVAINSTSGNLTMGTVNSNASNLTINEGTGTVTVNNLTIGTGNLTITTTNATVSSKASAISLAAVISGDVRLTSTGDIFVSGVVSVTSINAKSTAGDVIFGNTVTSSNLGGFISEATSATKATKIANLVTLAAGANAVVTGNLISNNATLAAITTSGVGNITITGNVDASVANNNLTLTAGSAVTIGGNVGSSSTAMGDLISTGTGIFLASGNVTTHCVNVSGFTTSITFTGDVKTDGVNGVNASTSGAGTLTFSSSITSVDVTNTGDIVLTSGSGALSVVGAIVGTNDVTINSISGNITLGGAISTTGPLANIEIDTVTSGNVIIGSNVSTSGGGDILLGADVGGISTGAGNVTINGTVTTTGAGAGDILIGISGGTATVNQPLTAGPTGDVVFLTNLLTDAITVVSGATITAGDSIGDFGAGTLNLGANITAGTTGIAATLGIFVNDLSVNLTGAVSLKSIGTGGGAGILLNKVNGAQNLTLEAVNGITLNNVGQTTPLNTVTITNSTGVNAGAFNAAKVVLSNTTGLIAFGGPTTTISTSLTTTANAYDVTFDGTTTIFGAPVFLNTGNVSFAGNTALISGVTITGAANSTVTLAINSNISSGGVFNIGALPTTTINDGISIVLLGSNSSTFAGVVIMADGDEVFLNGNTLTLSGDSSATFKGDFYLYDSALNVTGKLNSASAIFLNGGTITGAGGTIANLTAQAIGTVDPQGTLNTGIVTFNAATTYIADVLTTTTATNLTGNAGFSLGGATLSLSSVASGLGIGNSFTIINNTAVSGGLSGTFAGLPEGATLSAKDSLGNTITFAISYVGGIIGANDVTLTVTNVSIANPSAIPQPMVAGQPQLNYLTAEGAGEGGGPMVTVTLDIIPGLTTVPTYFSFFAYDEGFTGGVHVALNELDGNTDTKEIITGPGAGGGPNVKVFQFNIRTLTFNPTPVTSFFAFNDPAFTGGVYVAGGDVTGDGIGDLLVGAGEGGGPRVQVYAGSVNGVITSSPISDFFAYSTEFLGGVVVAAGDRTGDTTLEVVTGPASNGGYNIKSFNVAGTGNNPTLIENFFAFNDFTSIGGLSIATAVFDANPMDDLVIGTTNTQFGIILNQDYEGIQANPFPGFDGEIRAGFVSSVLSQTYQAVAAAGPGGGPVLSVFIVDPINLTLTQTDSLFVFVPEFTGGLFVAN
jgi:fibronectin-binding autotransporter adhesin